MISGQEFLSTLRSTLRNLYDPNELRSSPLVALFRLEHRVDPSSDLRELLVEAIESLRPGDDTPSQSRMWRTYETLQLRYVQQFDQAQVAGQLGFGVRQLRREERAALLSLVHRLAQAHQLDISLDQEADIHEQSTATKPLPVRPTPQDVREADLFRLHQSEFDNVVDLGSMLSAIFDLMEPLATEYSVCLCRPSLSSPVRVKGSLIVLRQILISLLGIMIHQSASGHISMAMTIDPSNIQLRFSGIPKASSRAPLDEDDRANLDVAYRLAQASNVHLEISSDSHGFGAHITLLPIELVRVLVIDDHPDAIELVARYTHSTRYEVIGLDDPSQVVTRACELQPDIIMLDVMMPMMDGWQIIGLVKENPVTRHIPLLVCTILPQEELANALGAAGFLQKPVTRLALLNALDQVVQAIPRQKR